MICLLLFLFSNSKSTAHYLTEIWTGVKGSKAKTCSKFYYSNIYQLLNTSTGTRNYILMLKYLQSSLFSAFIQSIQSIKSTTSISFHTTCITVHYFPRTFRVTVYCGIFVTWWAWAGLGGGRVSGFGSGIHFGELCGLFCVLLFQFFGPMGFIVSLKLNS